jgi:hypothetical protein
LVTLEFEKAVLDKVISANQAITIRTLGASRIVAQESAPEGGVVPLSTSSPTTELKFDPKALAGRSRVSLNIMSNITDAKLDLKVDIPTYGTADVGTALFPIGPADNKHGGTKTCDEDDDSDECSVYIFSSFAPLGGASSTQTPGANGSPSVKIPPKNASYLRYTTDNAPGKAAIYIYRNDGGPYAVLAKGKPMDRPVSAQLSLDGNTLWIVDQENSTLFSLPFPSRKTFESLFGSQ